MLHFKVHYSSLNYKWKPFALPEDILEGSHFSKVKKLLYIIHDINSTQLNCGVYYISNTVAYEGHHSGGF